MILTLHFLSKEPVLSKIPLIFAQILKTLGKFADYERQNDNF